MYLLFFELSFVGIHQLQALDFEPTSMLTGGQPAHLSRSTRSSWVEAFLGLPPSGKAQLVKSVKYLSGKHLVGSWGGVPGLYPKLRRGFCFPASFSGIASSFSTASIGPPPGGPRRWPSLCTFLLCFSSFDHFVWVYRVVAFRHRLSAGKISSQAHRGTH